MQQLRASGIRCELYPEMAKFDRQFKYAEKKNIPYVVIIGSEELAKGICTMKDIRSGVQASLSFEELLVAKFQ